MQSITHKPILKKISEEVKNLRSLSEQINYVHQNVLKKKVKFPLLEYFTTELFQIIPIKNQIKFTDGIVALDEIGSYTLAGKFLQLRLFSPTQPVTSSGVEKKSQAQPVQIKNLNPTFKKASEYIIRADKWYACDIIGERVFGAALLHSPEKTIPYLNKLAKHKNKWMVRTVGVATHFAVKKGLNKKHADTVFKLLLSLSNTTDFHTKKGIGWAAKTTAKFHPLIIKKYEKEIYSNPEVKQWFKTKIKIGLGRTRKNAGRFK